MVSKMVTDRQKLNETMAAWCETHGVVVAEGVRQALGKKADPTAVIKGVGAHLAQLMVNAVVTDEAHTGELSDDVAPRAERDEAAEAVGEALVELRQLVEASSGTRGLADMGLSESVPRDPVARERVALRVVEVGSAPGFKLPLRKGVKVDVDVFIDGLRPKASRLTAALKLVKKEEAEGQATQAAKDAAIEAFDAAFVAATGLLYGLSVLAGQRALGDRLPTLTRTRAAVKETAPDTTTPA
jgi:hypothetical protein